MYKYDELKHINHYTPMSCFTKASFVLNSSGKYCGTIIEKFHCSKVV